MDEIDTEGLQLVVDDLDKAEASVDQLDKHTQRLVKKLIGEVRRWRKLGTDLVHGAKLASLPKERAELEANYASAVERLHDLEGRQATDALLIEHAILQDEVKRLRKEISALKGATKVADEAR